MQERGAVHPRHLDVRDDDVGGLALERREGFLAARGKADVPLVAVAAKRVAQAVQDLRLVVGEQDPLAWRLRRLP